MTYAGTIKEVERRSNENLKPHKRCRDKEKKDEKEIIRGNKCGGQTCLLTLEIADHFKPSPVTIGEAMIKVEDLLRKDKSFENVLKRIGKNWSMGGRENTLFPLPDPNLLCCVIVFFS